MTTLRDIIRDAIIEAAEQQRKFDVSNYSDETVEPSEPENIMIDYSLPNIDDLLSETMEAVKELIGAEQ